MSELQTSERRIKLSDPPKPEPESEPMPLEKALRWLSSYEDRVTGLVNVFLTQHAYLRCTEHAESDLSHEVGGVLVGRTRQDEDGRLYIVVEDVIQAEHTQFGPTHLTFTQDSLVQLNNTLEDQFPGKQMVGWYHTHPRMDVFLSSYDTWLHTSFFFKPWQVALVMEPFADKGGFFCWQPEGQLDPRHYVGFYEMADAGDESVVSWVNLEPEEDE